MDSVYPEPLSRLYRRTVRKKVHKNNAARYKTQPVTFAEIQEVDEEGAADETPDTSAAAASKSELDLKTKFEEFKRQRDKDLWEGRLSTKTVENNTLADDNSCRTENNNYETNNNNNSSEHSSLPQRQLPSIVVTFRGNSSGQRPSI